MAGRSGTAVVLDVHTGQVLASYRMDVAAQRIVHPGSSIKPFTLMALLASGKVDGGTALMCKRSAFIGGHRLDCTHPVTGEPLDPAAALAYSCNSYFTTVALRLTPEQLHDSLVREGFASTTALAPKEAAGRVALAQSTEQLQLQAIGEWGVSVTPLELLRGYRGIALEQTKHDAKLAPLFDGLQQSISYGMGHAAQPDTRIKVAGKTGTASADEGPWTHAWFAGYAPAENPEIVLVVFLEKGHGWRVMPLAGIEKSSQGLRNRKRHPPLGKLRKCSRETISSGSRGRGILPFRQCQARVQRFDRQGFLY